MDPKYNSFLKQLEDAIDSKEFPRADSNGSSCYYRYIRKLEANMLADMLAATSKVLENVPDCYANQRLKKLSDILHRGTQADEDKNSTNSSTESHLPPKHPETLSVKQKTFRIMMDVDMFKSKDIDVKVVGGQLVVEGKRDMHVDGHGMIRREFIRKFEIPEGVDVETFRAILDCYNVLTIEASPLPVSKNKALDVIVPGYTNSENPLQSLKYKEDMRLEEFEKEIERHIADGMGMVQFANKLIGKLPSDYIPLDEVIE